ncbi:MAG: GNAT family N-acetyltransferase [Actinobacteria bacterium]|nr:MAG: GNAT family N-acetyltransferase [Actinomycetota bacterium]TMK19378.1 MAG: GNAT family N-acetyltransferase [Actinomycetota bacterium]TMK94669.1 MAG: GNAT family N-acetyltransferase [Actinomycetota bacterium]TMM24641.1 MAG: GNAT family N-acetyltransferase [Actinomycetota bacterium]
MNITFELVPNDRRRLLPLLLLADESEAIVESYLDRGTLFAILDGGTDIGVLLLIHEGDAVEVKNLALAEAARGQGVGTLAVSFAATWAREGGVDRLTVGTANSSLDAIRFYQKVGFRMSEVKRGFFDAYPEPIWEDGLRARDMLMFELAL